MCVVCDIGPNEHRSILCVWLATPATCWTKHHMLLRRGPQMQFAESCDTRLSQCPKTRRSQCPTTVRQCTTDKRRTCRTCVKHRVPVWKSRAAKLAESHVVTRRNIFEVICGVSVGVWSTLYPSWIEGQGRGCEALSVQVERMWMEQANCKFSTSRTYSKTVWN